MLHDFLLRCAYIQAMRLVLLLTLAVWSPLCFGGVVRTLDGRTLYGQIGLGGDDQIVLTPKEGKAIRIPLADLLSAHFRATALGGAVLQQARWTGRDVGEPALPGASRFDGNLLTVRASGADIAGARDQFYFIFQTLAGDGQIVARVSGVQLSSPRARAGLMIRAGLDHAAPCAMAAVSAAEGTQFHSRQRLSQRMVIRNGRGDNPPVWLKLVRRGQEISGYHSADGADWTLIASEQIALPAQAMIGLAVCSANPAAICTATFERIAISTGTLEEVEADPRSTPRGVMLRDGSFLAGRIASADASSVRLVRGQEMVLPRGEISRLFLAPVKHEWVGRIPAGRPGILLAGGDYLECSLQELGESVKVTSVLFGQRRFARDEVLAAVLDDTPARPAAHEVRLTDGSLLLAGRIVIEPDAMRISTRSAGELRFGVNQVLEIRAGALRQQALTGLKPAQVDGAAGRFTINSLPAGLSMRLGGQDVERGIGLGAGVTVGYALGGQYRILMAQAGVPEGVLPVNPVRLVIVGDGREIYRSAPRTSLDEPLEITLNVAGVRLLQARIEGQAPDGIGATLLLADPALAR